MILILACLVHHYFTACHCTSLFFLSCLVAVTIEPTCHLNVYTASQVHACLHYGCLWFPRLNSTAQVHPAQPLPPPNCSAELPKCSLCHSEFQKCLRYDANDDSMVFLKEYEQEGGNGDCRSFERETHTIHLCHSLPFPHSVQRKYSAITMVSCTHVKLRLSTTFLLFIHCLQIISMNNQEFTVCNYKDLKPNSAV
jgi:hypothetical protein